MKTFIYKSRKKDELYLYIIEKDDFSDIPASLFDAMGAEPVFVMELDLCERDQLAREDIAKVRANLTNQGYHVQMPPRPELSVNQADKNALH